MPKSYNPANWYWVVGGSTTQVFSSTSGDYVPVSNAAYVAWLADGTMPTQIGSEAELGDVLAPYQIRPTAANVLEGYKESQSNKLTVEVVAKVLFKVVNDVRVLQGQSTINAAQFKAFLKGLM